MYCPFLSFQGYTTGSCRFIFKEFQNKAHREAGEQVAAAIEIEEEKRGREDPLAKISGAAIGAAIDKAKEEAAWRALKTEQEKKPNTETVGLVKGREETPYAGESVSDKIDAGLAAAREQAEGKGELPTKKQEHPLTGAEIQVATKFTKGGEKKITSGFGRLEKLPSTDDRFADFWNATPDKESLRIPGHGGFRAGEKITLNIKDARGRKQDNFGVAIVLKIGDVVTVEPNHRYLVNLEPFIQAKTSNGKVIFIAEQLLRPAEERLKVALQEVADREKVKKEPAHLYNVFVVQRLRDTNPGATNEDVQDIWVEDFEDPYMEGLNEGNWNDFKKVYAETIGGDFEIALAHYKSKIPPTPLRPESLVETNLVPTESRVLPEYGIRISPTEEIRTIIMANLREQYVERADEVWRNIFGDQFGAYLKNPHDTVALDKLKAAYAKVFPEKKLDGALLAWRIEHGFEERNDS